MLFLFFLLKLQGRTLVQSQLPLPYHVQYLTRHNYQPQCQIFKEFLDQYIYFISAASRKLFFTLKDQTYFEISSLSSSNISNSFLFSYFLLIIFVINIDDVHDGSLLSTLTSFGSLLFLGCCCLVVLEVCSNTILYTKPF
jgi:hypothetical protein